MGYSMSVMDQRFWIKAENRPAALAAIKALAGKETIRDSGGRHFSWINDSREFVEAETFKEAMDAWRWWPSQDPNGDVVKLTFQGESLGDDKLLFEAIAPFVERGSYIQMRGGDGDIWRWGFDGQRCHEVHAVLSFPGFEA